MTRQQILIGLTAAAALITTTLGAQQPAAPAGQQSDISSIWTRLDCGPRKLRRHQ